MGAWLLLLLRDGESYGRELIGQLSERAISVDRGLAYRRLRELDADGAITSRWAQSDAGPRRRCYRLTAIGQLQLAEHATSIEETRQRHDAFMRAYAHAIGDKETGPGPRRGSDGRIAQRMTPVDDDDEDAKGRRDDRDQAESPHDAGSASLGRELVAAWVLLLLIPGESYGYDLRRALTDRDLHPDPGAMYRLLRTLERDGWLQSRWTTSPDGPRRRLYELTSAGRSNIGRLADVISTIRDSHTAFLDAYKRTPPSPRVGDP